MKRPTRPCQAILKRCARPYSSQPSPSEPEQWPLLKRRTRPGAVVFDNGGPKPPPEIPPRPQTAHSWLRDLDQSGLAQPKTNPQIARPQWGPGHGAQFGLDNMTQAIDVPLDPGYALAERAERLQSLEPPKEIDDSALETDDFDEQPEDTLVHQWLWTYTSPLGHGLQVNHDWGIRLEHDVVKLLDALKARRVAPGLEFGSRRNHGRRSGRHKPMRKDPAADSGEIRDSDSVDWSRKDLALSIMDHTKRVELRLYPAYYMWPLEEGSELWCRNMDHGEWGWQRIDAGWTIRRSHGCTELLRVERKTQKAGTRLHDEGTGLMEAGSSSLQVVDKAVLLTIRGLPTNLTGRDFYRISPKSLSSWENTIKKVQQERHPVTLEPTGVYKLSFSTGLAAASYLHDLKCRHHIAKAKVMSQSGLWENSVSRYLRKRHELEEAEASFERSSLDEDTTIGPNAFTIGPPSMAKLDAKRGRITNSRWLRTLEDIVGDISHDRRPSTVLVDVYPPNLAPELLEDIFKLDEQTRGVSWEASKVVPLQPLESLDQELPDPDGEQDQEGRAEEISSSNAASTNGKGPVVASTSKAFADYEAARGRFVICFPSDSHAARFQRSWHRQTVTLPGNNVSYDYSISVQTVRW